MERKCPKLKSGKGWTSGRVLQGLSGAVSLNLLSASMIVKEQRLGEGGGVLGDLRFLLAPPADNPSLFYWLFFPPSSHSITVPLTLKATLLRPLKKKKKR